MEVFCYRSKNHGDFLLAIVDLLQFKIVQSTNITWEFLSRQASHPTLIMENCFELLASNHKTSFMSQFWVERLKRAILQQKTVN